MRRFYECTASSLNREGRPVNQTAVAERLESRRLFAADGLFAASFNFQPAKSSAVPGFIQDNGTSSALMPTAWSMAGPSKRPAKPEPGASSITPTSSTIALFPSDQVRGGSYRCPMAPTRYIWAWATLRCLPGCPW